LPGVSSSMRGPQTNSSLSRDGLSGRKRQRLSKD